MKRVIMFRLGVKVGIGIEIKGKKFIKNMG